MNKYIIVLLTLFSCTQKTDMTVSDTSVKAGTSVNIRGNAVMLSEGQLEVGESFLAKVKNTDLGFEFNNRVTIVSFVPSIDTKVCEAQTHILGETEGLDGIDLVTISRDLPTAQIRFAKEAKLENIKFYTDYKSGNFGNSTGLMMKSKELLARGVLVLDKEGIIRYIQIVDELTNLPDMEKAFQFARQL